ncbi:MAG: hypothetical protein R3F14_25135 [Polyangiaceae bacterium]
MNQPPGGNPHWPSAPPSGAAGPGHTQLGEPPPEALQQAPVYGTAPAGMAPMGGGMAGAPVSPTVADPGLGQGSPYGPRLRTASYGQPSSVWRAPARPLRWLPPDACPAPARRSGGSGLGLVLGILGLVAGGGALAAFLLIGRGSDGDDAPVPTVEPPTPAPVTADPVPADTPAPADTPTDTPSPSDTPPPVASPAPTPTYTYTPTKPVATATKPASTATKPTSTATKPTTTTKPTSTKPSGPVIKPRPKK